MFDNSDTTFSVSQLIRTFTIVDTYIFTIEAISFDNEWYEGDEFIINYENTN